LALLVERTSKDKRRPLLQVDDPRTVLQRVLEVRDPLYREVATWAAPTDDQNPRQLAKNIAAEYQRLYLV